MTFTDLANKLRKLNVELAAEGSRIAVEVALVIVDDLTEVTPVDTSKAESNWQVSLGSPVTKEIEAHVPGHFGWTAVESRIVARANARKALQNKKPGVSIFIGNAADYIQDLNEGSSKQEPAGFVERAELKGRLTLKASRVKMGLK